MEELADENKSLIWILVKQVRPGMDLSKVVLPTFILEPRSFLDKLSDSYYHADILSRWVAYKMSITINPQILLNNNYCFVFDLLKGCYRRWSLYAYEDRCTMVSIRFLQKTKRLKKALQSHIGWNVPLLLGASKRQSYILYRRTGVPSSTSVGVLCDKSPGWFLHQLLHLG